MSFAGHVYDMILLLPDISAEEFEEIDRQVKEREQGEKYYFFRAKLVMLCFAVGVLLLVWLISSL